jgi:hypothetical protein
MHFRRATWLACTTHATARLFASARFPARRTGRGVPLDDHEVAGPRGANEVGHWKFPTPPFEDVL